MSRHIWTEHELGELRRRYPHEYTADIAASLGVTTRAVYHKANKIGLAKTAEFRSMTSRRTSHSGAGTRFKSGDAPWNKGMIGYSPGGRSNETRFRPGNMPTTHATIGAECVRCGYRYRKVSDTRSRRDWRQVHVIEWEAANGPVPDGHCVIFIDNDRSNTSLDNLECVPRGVLARLNQQGYADLPVELRPSAIAVSRLECKRFDLNTQ